MAQVMGQFKENVLPRGTPYVPEAGSSKLRAQPRKAKPKPKPKPKSESTFRRPTAGGAAAEARPKGGAPRHAIHVPSSTAHAQGA